MADIYEGEAKIISLMKKPNELVFKIEFELECNTELFKKLDYLVGRYLHLKIVNTHIAK